jgi:hypothetical protein
MERGTRAADAIGGNLVYAGFSLGVVPAQMLAQTRPGALGALLCYSCVPVSEFGEAWPADVPVQIHGMDADPIFFDEGDIDAARAIVASAPRSWTRCPATAIVTSTPVRTAAENTERQRDRCLW